MQTSELVAWVASGILALLGGWAILVNYVILIRWYVRRKHGSLLPVFGGVLLAAAIFICPLPGVRRWAWLPFVVDLGCTLSLPGFLYSVLVLKVVRHMSAHSSNETWIVEAGDAVIEKKAREGICGLTPVERIIYCLWVADYGMRNAGDLDTAHDVYSDFQTDAARLAQDLRLPVTHSAFELPTAELQRQYFERFEQICDEVRDA